MRNLILFAEKPKIFKKIKCVHKTKIGSKYYLPTAYAKKYNNCLLCALEIWNGPITHLEISKCLGTSRINVCLIERKAINKIKKNLSLKAIDNCVVKVFGLANSIDRDTIVRIAEDICTHFDIVDMVYISFTDLNVELDGKYGRALYIRNNDIHDIIIKSNFASHRNLLITLIHELFHAYQYERKAPLNDDLADFVGEKLIDKFYKKMIKYRSLYKKNHMTGINNSCSV